MRKLIAGLLALLLTAGLFAPTTFASKAKSTAPAGYEITVVFKSETLPANAAAIIESAGGTVIRSYPDLGVMTINGPAAILDTLNGRADVETASPSIPLLVPGLQKSALSRADLKSVSTAGADLYHRYGWDIKQVTNDGASWNLAGGSHRTVVGIIDTGVNTRHQDLKGNLLGGRNFYPDGPGGKVVPTDIEDRNGHGSHVAGSIAGKGRMLGVGPDLGFKAYRVFGAGPSTADAIIIDAILFAATDGVDVINMSLGGYDILAWGYWTDPETGTTYRFRSLGSFLAYKRAIRYAVRQGVTVVAAAGNDAIEISKPMVITAWLNETYGPYGYFVQGASRETPGSLPGVIAVAATGPDQSLSSYSNWGAGAIDIAAPGGDFRRYPVGDWFLDMCLSTGAAEGGTVNTYYLMAGTSMAAPKVAAVAGLVIDQARARGERLQPSQVTARLLQSAVDLGKSGYDGHYGNGFLSAYYALGGK